MLLQRRITVAKKYEDQVGEMILEKGYKFPDELYIFQKDSKTISILNVPNKTIQHKQVDFKGSFPHNFQMIQLGKVNSRVFLIGGGDYKSLPDSMFQCRELVVSQDKGFGVEFVFKDKSRMQYARHGHAVIGIADTYIMVSGSRKEVSGASQKVELYDTNQDEWMELQNLNEGRHYHSCANFENSFMYIFGGIQNQSKKYSNTIERLNFSLKGIATAKWVKIQIGDPSFYNPGQQPISARQGAGMCQFSEDEILIVGGFNGKFLQDFYTFKVNALNGTLSSGNKYTRDTKQNQVLFPFQVPTVGDTSLREALSVDWSQMQLFSFKNN
jgi:hypothetical protein